MTTPKVHVIHENEAWTAPLVRELGRLGIPHELWFLDEGLLDLSVAPPPGIFYNRMSASSHTRHHRFAPEYAGCVLAWLERHGRVVLNGSSALALEVSKVAQYEALAASGIRTPRTIAAIGTESVVRAAARFGGTFITKHNRGGKGIGVAKFNDVAALRAHLDSPAYEPPIDGVTLVQSYIESPDRFITRCEFVGGRFLYAVRVDTAGGFELCPADACAASDAACPVGEAQTPGFEIIEAFTSPLIRQYEACLRANRVDIAGVEFIVDREGSAFTYDINTNTNYNAQAEAQAGCNAMADVAAYLATQLENAAPTASEPLRVAG